MPLKGAFVYPHTLVSVCTFCDSFSIYINTYVFLSYSSCPRTLLVKRYICVHTVLRDKISWHTNANMLYLFCLIFSVALAFLDIRRHGWIRVELSVTAESNRLWREPFVLLPAFIIYFWLWPSRGPFFFSLWSVTLWLFTYSIEIFRPQKIYP